MEVKDEIILFVCRNEPQKSFNYKVMDHFELITLTVNNLIQEAKDFFNSMYQNCEFKFVNLNNSYGKDYQLNYLYLDSICRFKSFFFDCVNLDLKLNILIDFEQQRKIELIISSDKKLNDLIEEILKVTKNTYPNLKITKQKYPNIEFDHTNSLNYLNIRSGDTLLLSQTNHFKRNLILDIQNKQYKIKINDSLKICELSQFAADELNVDSISNIRLMKGYKLMNPTHQLLVSEVIQISDCVIYAFKETEGGGEEKLFVDISNDKIKREISFSDDAPEYRVCTSGLNIEGICQNNQCKYFEKLQINPLGFGYIDIIRKEYDKIKCINVDCKKPIKIQTCGFYNCFYGWIGEKYENEQWVLSKSKDLIEACSTKYTRFNTSLNTQTDSEVPWCSLIISVIEKVPTSCQLCNLRISKGKEGNMSKCKSDKHLYHKSCILDISKSQANMNSCIICHKET